MIKIPIFEYQCDCGYHEEKLEFGKEMEEDHICPECDKLMDRLVSLSKFKLIYDPTKDICSWGYDGYASSQYWDAVKEERAKGNDVKPVIDGDKY